jgi:hypothetical protein
MQYHRDHPLIHRICASANNARPMKMMGIEVFRRAPAHRSAPVDEPGFDIEYADSELTAYRVRLDPGHSTGRRRIPSPSLVVTIRGSGRLSMEDNVASNFELGAGDARWLGDAAHVDLANRGDDELDAVLVAIR